MAANARILTVLGFACLGAAGALAAADLTIRQKGRMFSQDSVSIRRGETLTFLNDDNVPHNIMSTSAGNEFDLGSVAPGNAVPVTFDRAGLVNVICAIHPRMKMAVNVAP